MFKLAGPYAWPPGRRCAAVFSADVDGESPYMWRNRGQSVDRLAEIEQRRFGPRVGLKRLIDLLAEFDAKGSFYVPAIIAELYPEVLEGIAASGHEAGAHGFYHERVDEIAEDHNARVLDRSLAVFEKRLGRAPEGYRSPSWELTPAVHRQLRERGFAYDSSLMGFDHPYSLDGLVEVPVTWVVDDAVYFRYSGPGHTDKTPVDPDLVLNHWKNEFDAMVEFGGLFMITVHPWMSGRGARVRMLRQLFAYIRATPGVWFTTAAEVARWHARSPNREAFDLPVKLVSTEVSLE